MGLLPSLDLKRPDLALISSFLCMWLWVYSYRKEMGIGLVMEEAALRTAQDLRD